MLRFIHIFSCIQETGETLYVQDQAEAERISARTRTCCAVRAENGDVYLCSERPVNVLATAEDFLRARALEKLNQEEKKVLGLL